MKEKEKRIGTVVHRKRLQLIISLPSGKKKKKKKKKRQKCQRIDKQTKTGKGPPRQPAVAARRWPGALPMTTTGSSNNSTTMMGAGCGGEASVHHADD